MGKTHPPPDERLLVLLASMGEQLDSYQDQPDVAERFRAQLNAEGS